jgi:hypothetical protein
MLIASLILQNIDPVAGVIEQVSTLATSTLDVLDNDFSDLSFSIHRSNFAGEYKASSFDLADTNLNTNFFPSEEYKSSFLKASDLFAKETLNQTSEVDQILDEIILYPVANPLQSAYKTFLRTVEYGNSDEEKINQLSNQS